jgi:multidrug efflux system membrane fusion protein
VVVPRSVVTLNADGALGVRTVVDGDEVAFVPVAVIDDTAEGLVVDGVPEGAKVVISGQDLVVDGETVNAVMAASVDAATGSQAPPAGAGAATNR